MGIIGQMDQDREVLQFNRIALSKPDSFQVVKPAIRKPRIFATWVDWAKEFYWFADTPLGCSDRRDLNDREYNLLVKAHQFATRLNRQRH